MCDVIGCVAVGGVVERVGRTRLVEERVEMCDQCLESMVARHSVWRQHAGAMRDRGVPEPELQRVMCDIVDAYHTALRAVKP